MKIQTTFFILFFSIIVCFSCQSQKSNSQNDTYKIVNLIISNHECVSLKKETFANFSDKNPSDLIDPYLGIYNQDLLKQPDSLKNKNIAYKVFYEELDGLINKAELLEMKSRYNSWSIDQWDFKKIPTHNSTIQQKEEEEKDVLLLTLSEPLFTQDRNKAIILEKYLLNNTGGYKILVLEKRNTDWILKSSIAIGTIHSNYH